MSAILTDCPLMLWLDRRGESLYSFAQRVQGDVPQRTVYRLCQGRRVMLDTLIAVSAATGGEVTLGQLADWRARIETRDALG